MIEAQERYKTSLSEAVAAESDRDYCPECGRIWHAVAHAPAAQSDRATWWGLAMVATGIYLIVFFSPSAWLAMHGDALNGILPTVTCLTAGTEQDYADCDPAKSRAGAATGLIWTAIGLGLIARLTSLEGRRTSPSSPSRIVGRSTSRPFATIGLALQTFVETAGRTFFQLQLLLVCYLASSQLIEGAAPSWTLIARAIDRSIIVVQLL